ncbi:MAG: hypothetical protein QOJ85_4691, partial [Solirubrobacteraceae bacterium]|nr:hypothetical protein [Solirubrobacteraceae bacterium]
MKRILSCVGVAVLIALPASARAAGGWSAPQSLGAGQDSLLALPGGGLAVLGSTGLDFASAPSGTITPVPPSGFTGLISPAGQLGPLVALTSKQDIRAAVAASDGKLTVFGAVGATNTVRASVGRTGGSFGAARTLHVANGSLLGATLARSGPVALLRRCFTRGCQKADIVLVHQTSAGWSQPRAITRPVDVNRGAVLAGGLVALPDGEIAVAYERDNVLYLRRVTPMGKVSAAQRLGAAIQARIVLAPMGGHRLLVAWAWQAVNEDYAHSPFHVRLACSNTAGHFSGHSQALATIPLTGAERYVQGPGIALAGRTLAWTDYAGGRYDVRAGDIDDACAITAQTVAIPGSDVVLDDLA